MPAPGGFFGGLGSLFAGGETPEEQRRAALFEAGLATLAGAQQPGQSFGGALFGGLQAGAGALQQAQQNNFRAQQLKTQQDRETRQVQEEAARLKLSQDEQARKQRSDIAGVATRVATGLATAKDPLGQFRFLSQVPDVQSALAAAQIDPSTITTPEALQEAQQRLAAFGQAGADQNKQSGSSFGPVNPGQFTPASVQKYSQSRNYADLVPYVPPAQPQISLINGVPNVVTPSRTGGPVLVNPLSTLSNTSEAAAELERAKAEAAAIGKAEAERASTFQKDLNIIDDEILRTQRILTEFQNGKYQTGPFLGGLSTKYTTAGQDLAREAGKDVLKGISEATFGALSEGEREFIKTLGINPNSSEESNINLLTQRLQELQRTKQRLIQRPPIQVQKAKQGAAPKDFSSMSDDDLLKEISGG